VHAPVTVPHSPVLKQGTLGEPPQKALQVPAHEVPAVVLTPQLKEPPVMEGGGPWQVTTAGQHNKQRGKHARSINPPAEPLQSLTKAFKPFEDRV